MTEPGARSPAGKGLPEALVARFRQTLERSWSEGGRLGLAVSGGTDSLAMLLLAQAAIPGRFAVATVDHGLRSESAAECAMVVKVCAARSIPCEVLRVEVSRGNLQAQARAARYRALGEWAKAHGLSALATAHHADDQAETLLMRLNRGSGTAGLAGVRQRGTMPTSGIPVHRPLLGWRRAELERLVRAGGLDPVSDPSNADDRFERARVRKVLAQTPFLDPAALAGSAGHLADADDALEWAARIEWDERTKLTEGEVRYRPRAPRAVALRVIERAVSHFGGSPRGGDVARLLEQLEAREKGNIARVLATVEGDEWVFRREPPRRPS